MRVVSVLVSMLLLAFGFLLAMALMLFGLIARLFGRRPARPNPMRTASPTDSAGSPGSGARPVAASFSRGEVIDIEATPAKE